MKAQINYSIIDKETLAAEKGILHFDHCSRGKKFILKTDHQALQCIKTTLNHNSRVLRTALKLQEYDYTPIYIKRETNIADILSKPSERITINIPQTAELDEQRKESILEKYHQLLGHGSAANMKFLIKNIHEWTEIHSDIHEHVKKCLICSQAREGLINSKNRVISTSFPNELGEVDLIGRIPTRKVRTSLFLLLLIIIESG